MKKRVGSAIVMIAIFVPLLLLGGVFFAFLVTLLALGAMYEMMKLRDDKKKIPSIIKVLTYFMIIFTFLLTYRENIYSYNLDYRLISFIMFVFILPILFGEKKLDYNIKDALYLVGTLLFILISFNLIVVIRNYDLNYLIYLLLITVFTDTFAYITGKYIGKTKLAPSISPNKTMEGLVGGLLMGTFVPTVFYVTVINPSISLVVIVFITLFLSLVGQLGDLVFSSIKRTYNVKVFSNLIPGHGGILDRFDSLIFVVLAFIIIVGVI